MLQHLLAPRALLEFKCFERQRHMICILGDERPFAGDVTGVFPWEVGGFDDAPPTSVESGATSERWGRYVLEEVE